MLDVSLSVPITNNIKIKIEQWLFLKYYQHSHSNYLEHHHNNGWRDYKNYGFSIKIHLENYKRNSINDVSTLSILNDKSKTISNIKFLLEAHGVFEIFEQEVNFSKIDSKIKTIILNQIPFQSIDFYNEKIFLTYKKITITLLSIDDIKINEVILELQPTYSSLSSDCWDEKWGYNWNLRYIDDGKTKLRHFIYKRICGSSIRDLDIYIMHYLNPRKFIKSLIYKIMMFSPILNSLFWILLWKGNIRQNKDGYLAIYRTCDIKNVKTESINN